MLEKCKRFVDTGKAFGALLTGLPKAFVCLDHELRNCEAKCLQI